MTQTGIFVCAKRVINNFPQKSIIYACGYKNPVKAWITVQEIKAGQLFIICKQDDKLSLYLLNENGKTLQISGVFDLLIESYSDIQNNSMHWLVLSRMIKSILTNCFDSLSLNDLEQYKDDLQNIQNNAFEYVLNKKCQTWIDCKSIIFDMLKNIKPTQLSQKLLSKWTYNKRPSIKELHKSISISDY